MNLNQLKLLVHWLLESTLFVGQLFVSLCKPRPHLRHLIQQFPESVHGRPQRLPFLEPLLLRTGLHVTVEQGPTFRGRRNRLAK